MQEKQTPSSLDSQLQDLRKEMGKDGSDAVLLEQWQKRVQDKKPLTEEEVEQHLKQLEERMHDIRYGPALERSIYHATLERMRLKAQTKGKMSPEDLKTIQDLDRRITVAEYIDTNIDDVLDVLSRYERYRQRFDLDKGPSAVPRDVQMEQRVSQQMTQLRTLLPIRTTLWKMRHFENIGNTGAAAALYAQLPTELHRATREQRDAYTSQIDQQIRTVVGAKEVRKDGSEKRLIDELYLQMLEKHFQKTLDREKDLTGQTGAKAEAEKKAIRREREEITGEFLSYNYISLERRAQYIAMLTRSGHFGQPYENQPAKGDAKRDYGKMEKPEKLDEERGRKIDDMRRYTKDFREKVLDRKDQNLKIPGLPFEIPFDPAAHMEHLMTTGVVPIKLRLALPIAEQSTVAWELIDVQLRLLHKNWGVRDARTKMILQPIYEKLGLPVNYADLPQDQQRAALEKAVKADGKLRSTLQIMNDFKVQEGARLTDIENDLTMLEQLDRLKKPGELAPAGEPKEPSLPLDLSKLKTDEEIAGAYVYVLNQLTTVHPQALAKSQVILMQKLNTNLNLQIDVGDIEKQVGKAYIRETFYAIALLVGEVALAQILAWKTAKWLVKTTVKTPVVAARLAGKGINAMRGAGGAGEAAKGFEALSQTLDPKYLQFLESAEGQKLSAMLQGAKLTEQEMASAVRLYANLFEKFGGDDVMKTILQSEEFLQGLARHGDSPLFRLILRRSASVGGANGIEAGLETFQRMSKVLRIVSKGGKLLINTANAVAGPAQVLVGGIELYEAMELSYRIDDLVKMGLNPEKDIALASLENIRSYKKVSGVAGIGTGTLCTVGPLVGFMTLATAGTIGILVTPAFLFAQYQISEQEMNMRKTPDEQLAFMFDKIMGKSPYQEIVDSQGQTFKQWMDWFGALPSGLLHSNGSIWNINGHDRNMISEMENMEWRRRVLKVMLLNAAMQQAPELLAFENKPGAKFPTPRFRDGATQDVMMRYVQAAVTAHLQDEGKGGMLKINEVPPKLFEKFIFEALTVGSEHQQYAHFASLPQNSDERVILSRRPTLFAKFNGVDGQQYPKTFGDTEKQGGANLYTSTLQTRPDAIMDAAPGSREYPARLAREKQELAQLTMRMRYLRGREIPHAPANAIPVSELEQAGDAVFLMSKDGVDVHGLAGPNGVNYQLMPINDDGSYDTKNGIRAGGDRVFIGHPGRIGFWKPGAMPIAPDGRLLHKPDFIATFRSK